MRGTGRGEVQRRERAAIKRREGGVGGRNEERGEMGRWGGGGRNAGTRGGEGSEEGGRAGKDWGELEVDLGGWWGRGGWRALA